MSLGDNIDKGVDTGIKAGEWLNQAKNSRGLFLLLTITVLILFGYGTYNFFTHMNNLRDADIAECKAERKAEQKDCITMERTLTAEIIKQRVLCLENQIAEIKSGREVAARLINSQKKINEKL